MVGKAAISKCPRCSRPIRGDFNIQGVFAPSAYVAPAFCGECGTAMPWTESRLQAAHDLIEEMDELTPEDKKRLNESVSELPKDSPRTGLAVTRIKKIAMKVGKDTWGIFEKILIDVASQTAKKTLGLP